MTTLTRLMIPGLTGSDCVSAVTSHLKTVPGVGQMTVQVKSTGDSVVSVLSAAPLAESVLRGAVSEAGFSVGDVVVIEDALAAQMAQQAPGRQASRNATRIALAAQA